MAADDVESAETSKGKEVDQDSAPKVVRLSVNLAPDVAAALKRLAESKGVTVTEMVRRAISTENFFEEQRAEGRKILIADDDEENIREVLFR